jgi:hypothetical protein
VLSTLGAKIQEILGYISTALGSLPKLPGFSDAGPQFNLPVPPVSITSVSAAGAGNVDNAPGAGKNFGLPPIGRLAGGWLTEPIAGVGASGQRYSFVENGKPEYVSPAGSPAGARGGGAQIIVQAGAVQISGAAGPAQGWADAADALWADLNRRLQASMDAQGAT